ncbi:MAG: carboxypeptidase-like regulatory domain-containing protein [Gemmatimonadota bacterium]
MKPRRSCVRGCALGLALAAYAGVVSESAAQTVRGLLLEHATETPIELGRVLLVTADGDPIDETLTDAEGFFSLESDDAGFYAIVGSALGYRPAQSETVQVDEGGVVIVQLQLLLAPVPVPGVVVRADRLNEPRVPELEGTGFYERLERGRGDFLTPAEVRAHPGTYTPQLFREIHNVMLVPVTDGATGPWNDSIKIRKAMRGARADRTCAPMIWIDDVYTQLMPGEGLHDAIPKRDILGIEVHTPHSDPPLRYFRENHPDKICGVVLIWTRRRRP